MVTEEKRVAGQISREAQKAAANLDVQRRAAVASATQQLRETQAQLAQQEAEARTEVEKAHAAELRKARRVGGPTGVPKAAGQVFGVQRKEMRQIKAALQEQKEQLTGEIKTWGTESREEVGKSYEEILSDIEKQAEEGKGEIKKWEEEQTEVALRELREWREDKVQLPSGEWLDKSFVEEMEPGEGKDILTTQGLKAFKQWFGDKYVGSEDAGYFEAELVSELEPEEQKALLTGGEEGLKSYRKERGDIFSATGESMKGEDYKELSFTDRMVFKTGGYEKLQARYVTLDTGELVSKSKFEKMKPEEKEYLKKHGIEKYSEWAAEKSAPTGISAIWQAVTPWKEEKGETFFSRGAAGVFRYGGAMAGELLIPGVYTARHWGEMGPGWKAGSLALDVAAFVPIVGWIGKTGQVSARAAGAAGRGARIARIARSTFEIGRGITTGYARLPAQVVKTPYTVGFKAPAAVALHPERTFRQITGLGISGVSPVQQFRMGLTGRIPRETMKGVTYTTMPLRKRLQYMVTAPTAGLAFRPGGGVMAREVRGLASLYAQPFRHPVQTARAFADIPTGRVAFGQVLPEGAVLTGAQRFGRVVPMRAKTGEIITAVPQTPSMPQRNLNAETEMERLAHWGKIKQPWEPEREIVYGRMDPKQLAKMRIDDITRMIENEGWNRAIDVFGKTQVQIVFPEAMQFAKIEAEMARYAKVGVDIAFGKYPGRVVKAELGVPTYEAELVWSRELGRPVSARLPRYPERVLEVLKPMRRSYQKTGAFLASLKDPEITVTRSGAVKFTLSAEDAARYGIEEVFVSSTAAMKRMRDIQTRALVGVYGEVPHVGRVDIPLKRPPSVEHVLAEAPVENIDVLLRKYPHMRLPEGHDSRTFVSAVKGVVETEGYIAALDRYGQNFVTEVYPMALEMAGWEREVGISVPRAIKQIQETRLGVLAPEGLLGEEVLRRAPKGLSLEERLRIQEWPGPEGGVWGLEWDPSRLPSVGVAPPSAPGIPSAEALMPTPSPVATAAMTPAPITTEMALPGYQMMASAPAAVTGPYRPPITLPAALPGMTPVPVLTPVAIPGVSPVGRPAPYPVMLPIGLTIPEPRMMPTPVPGPEPLPSPVPTPTPSPMPFPEPEPMPMPTPMPIPIARPLVMPTPKRVPMPFPIFFIPPPEEQLTEEEEKLAEIKKKMWMFWPMSRRLEALTLHLPMMPVMEIERPFEPRFVAETYKRVLRPEKEIPAVLRGVEVKPKRGR